MPVPENAPKLVIRHEKEAPKEPSACGHRYRLLSQGDSGVAAWAHAVDIDGAKPHYHKRATELYYVLEGEGQVILDGEAQDVFTGTMLHIPPGSSMPQSARCVSLSLESLILTTMTFIMSRLVERSTSLLSTA